MKSVTIGECWTDFRRQVIPAAASDEQVSDMRAGFYAGAYLVLETMKALASIDNDLLSLTVLEIMQRETRSFIDEVHDAAQQERASTSGGAR
ncbi:hypothetical protein PQR34_45350 [Paraburkholderia sediminicola]|uniref:hypothetical protein n=1 Tax=Paraburkholderia sediminicola TaxID=458836 RepID=UPI0038BC43D5